MSMDSPKFIVDLNKFSKLAVTFPCKYTIFQKAHLIEPYALSNHKIPFPASIKNLRKVHTFRRSYSAFVLGKQGGQLGHGLAAGEFGLAVDDGQGHPLDFQSGHQIGVQVGVDHVD